MRFINFEEGRGPQELFIDETQAPELSAGKVIIQVHAFGINRADTLQRQGKYPPPPGESSILGLEAAGEIIAVADDVSQWRVGDKVFGLMPGGGYAEQAIVDAGHLMPLPSGVSMEAAAGLAEVFLTAYQALFSICDVQSGERALIHAGASGVGLAALQLCRLEDIETAVTASSSQKLESCKQMGATILINYKTQDFAKELSAQWQDGVNAIVDFVGGDYLNRNLQVLAKDGSIVYLAMLAGRYADSLDMALMLTKRARIQGSTLRSRTDEYKSALISAFTRDFLGEFATGNLQVNLDTVLDVDDIGKAHQKLEQNDTQGKVVVRW